MEGAAAVSGALLLELGYSARNGSDHAVTIGQLRSLPRESVPTEAWDRAIAVQGMLAGRGQHRGVRLPDLLVAASAEIPGLAVLHYDHDFELISGVTGQSCEWIMPPGSVS